LQGSNLVKIGLTYNVKQAGSFAGPEDAFEEFDAPETIEKIISVLNNLGHECVALGFGRSALQKVLEQNIDFVFNIAEGEFGRSREAHMPALLEMLGIPYSGPDPLTAALTLDKIMAKKIAADCNVCVPGHFIIENIDNFNFSLLNFPVVIKLAYEGSSKGLRRASKVYNSEQLIKQYYWLKENYPEQPIIAEQFISGREVTVGVIGNAEPKALGIMEIKPLNEKLSDFLYSLEVKRNYLKEVEYVCPPNIGGWLKDRVEQISLKLYKMFGCRDISRFDFRVDSDGSLYFLEVNPLPGLNPVSSDIVIMANLLSISYEHLIGKILDSALGRHKQVHAKV